MGIIGSHGGDIFWGAEMGWPPNFFLQLFGQILSQQININLQGSLGSDVLFRRYHNGFISGEFFLPPPPSPKSRVKVIPCIKEDFSGASQRLCKVSVNLWCNTILGSSAPPQVILCHNLTPRHRARMWHFARRGLYHYLMPDYGWRWLASIWWYKSISGQLLTYSLKYCMTLMEWLW